MRSRWYHRPTLHTALHEPRRASWLELLFDLVFVASILQASSALGDAILRGGSLAAAAKFASVFAGLWVGWTGFSFYANRFDVDDFVHRMLVFLQMGAVAAMGLSASAVIATPSSSRPFALAFAACQAIVVVIHIRADRQVPDAQAYARHWGGVFAVGAVACSLSPFVAAAWTWVCWAVGIAVILFAPFHRRSRELAERFPLDQVHLSERYGLLTLFVLGGSFLQVLSSLTAQGLSITSLLGGAFALLVTGSLWWVYFDDVGGSTIRKGRGSWVVWLIGHLPLTLALAMTASGLSLILQQDLTELPDPRFDWLLSGSLALALASVGIIDSVTERREAQLSDRTRVNVRFASSLVLLVIAQVGTRMKTGTFLTIVAAALLAQVLFDMFMAPLEMEELAPTASSRRPPETAAPRRDGPVRRDISEAVRRGAPSELRSDLYFFFMEGSWTRMLVTMVLAYLLLNVLFAGLFLLEPASIGAADATDFGRAFAFSVQTMSTIGYGTLSPQTPFADLLVTIEAAVGILVVALATGLMFAKASRPTASVLFSEPMVVTTMNGAPTLMFRAGNARGNEVVEASVRCAALVDTISPEGHQLRRLLDLRLVRDRSPIFTLSWTVMHVIDDDSPLAGLDLTEANGELRSIIVTILGHDSTYGTTTHARHIYHPEDIHLGMHFADVISDLPDGRLMVDYDLFHRIERDG